uniref:Uncharacterized protein n=1 Tax=viral metagenome TaxID=1070528 RepID=A0A6M3IPB0_9ZZZZ
MITITQDEVYTFNILNGQAQNLQNELQKAGAAQKSFIELLENKYNATFDPKTGTFTEKSKKAE